MDPSNNGQGAIMNVASWNSRFTSRLSAVAGVVAAQETYMTAAKHKATWSHGSIMIFFFASWHNKFGLFMGMPMPKKHYRDMTSMLMTSSS